MTVIICDICKEVTMAPPIRIDFGDGVHPHGGEVMTRTADCCGPCAAALPPISCAWDFEEVRRGVLAGVNFRRKPVRMDPLKNSAGGPARTSGSSTVLQTGAEGRREPDALAAVAAADLSGETVRRWESTEGGPVS